MLGKTTGFEPFLAAVALDLECRHGTEEWSVAVLVMRDGVRDEGEPIPYQ
jgi:hypothetical protein